jgi:LysM repeat protein
VARRCRRAAQTAKPIARVLPVLGVICAIFSVLSQGSSAEAQGPATAGTYHVAPGDSLWGISTRTGIAVDDLARMNGLNNPDLILAGQTLRLDGPAAAESSRAYLIQPGDTLSGIALVNGVSTERIAALNGLSNVDLILAGTTLDLPTAESLAALAIGHQGVGGSRIAWRGSPNSWAGWPYGPPIALVLHTADGAMHGIDGEFATGDSGLSTHFAVGLDGSIHQYVELADRAWGNGYVEPGHLWPGPEISPNHLTVSIETEDLGNPRQSVTDAQFRATVEVGRMVLRHYPSIRYLITHRALAPDTRPDDPGPRWTASGRFTALANALGLKPID